MTIEPLHSANNPCDAGRCGQCAIHEVCVAYAVDTAHPAQRPSNRYYRPETATGSHIFWSGDDFRHIYAVKSGCVKTYTVDEDGNERVRGFYLPGDLIGLDAICASSYPSNACAVAPSQICALPYTQLTASLADLPNMQTRMLHLMSKDLFIALSLSGDFTAEQRLAAFLLHLLDRERRQGLVKDNHIELLMSRRDIASYLRLAPETISRVLGRFQKSGWIQSQPKTLKVLNLAALSTLAEPVGILDDSRDLSLAA